MDRRDFLKVAGCATASLAMESCSSKSQVLMGSASPSKPNILMIVADDMNYDAVKWLGARLDGLTPNIDRMASQGIRFSNMFNAHSMCAPSRAAMLTGLYQEGYSEKPGTSSTNINPEVRTLPAILKQELGYMTGILAKETHYRPAEAYQWDVVETMVGMGMGRHPELYHDAALKFMNKASKEGKPFFLAANSHDPHRPFSGVAGEMDSLKKRYEEEIKHIENPPDFIAPPPVLKYEPSDAFFRGFLPDLPEVRQEVAHYLNSTHRFDMFLGRILDALRESGMQDNTLVIFLSDNGMHFPFAKSNCYLTSVKTPMVITWKGHVTPGSISHSLVSGVDLTPTILDAVNCPYRPKVHGKSFLRLFNDTEAKIRDHVFCSMNASSQKSFTLRGLMTEQYGYIYNHSADGTNQFYDGRYSGGESLRAMVRAAEHDPEIKRRLDFFYYRTKEEFYDYSVDPDALSNLVASEGHTSKVKEFREWMLRIMRENKDPYAKDFADHCAKAG